MATPRNIRRLAFQILVQLDAGDGIDDAQATATLTEDEDEAEKFTDGERKKAFAGDGGVWRRAAADAFMTEAAGWPAHRQAAVDARFRLAHHEMMSGRRTRRSW